LIRFNSKGVSGEFAGFHLDPIMKYASVPWPVASPAWGTFSLSHGQLTALAEFRDRVELKAPAPRRRFNGQVNVSLNIPQLDLKLDSKDLASTFGRLNINGRIVIGKNLDLSIGGQFVDIKEAREFAEMGIHGVDLYISTFGPTLSIISKQWPVLTSEVDPKQENLRN